MKIDIMPFTAASAAKLLGKTPQAMSSLIKRGRIKASKKGKSYTIPDKDLISYIDTRIQELENESKILQNAKKNIT